MDSIRTSISNNSYFYNMFVKENFWIDNNLNKLTYKFIIYIYILLNFCYQKSQWYMHIASRKYYSQQLAIQFNWYQIWTFSISNHQKVYGIFLVYEWERSVRKMAMMWLVLCPYLVQKEKWVNESTINSN